MGDEFSALFEQAYAEVEKHEVGGAPNGGLVNNPNDPGGLTKWGMSLRWLKSVGDLDGDGMIDGDIDGDGDVDAQDILAASRADAKRLYHRYWWQRYRYERLPKPVAIKTMDLSVNMGARQCHRELQRSCRASGIEVAVDGILGPNTLQACREVDPLMLIASLRSHAAGFYRMLIARNAALIKRGHDVPDFSVFEAGWMNRAYS